MGINTKERPLYTAPNWELESESGDDSYFSYFEISKGHQESIQSEILETAGKTELLPHRLSDAAHSHAVQFFEEVGNTFETDCKKGCSHCCYQPATVFPFEAIRIASVLKNSLSKEQMGLLKEKMKARVSDFKDSSVLKNINNKTGCPLLSQSSSGEQCSIYGNRPLTCRMAHSFSVKKCRLAFQKDRNKVQIPVSLELMSATSGIIEGVFEQLPKEKLDGNLYELCSVVLVALSHDEAALKWANGDLSVFKDCIKDDT